MYDAAGKKTWEAELDIYDKVRKLASGTLSDCDNGLWGRNLGTKASLIHTAIILITMRKLFIALVFLTTILLGCKKSKQEGFPVSQLNWTAVNNGLPNTYAYLLDGVPINLVKSLAIQGNNIYAGTHGDGIYLSINNGNSWTPLNGSPSYLFNQIKYNCSINKIAVQENNIYAGTNNGVYLSRDTGKTWIGVNTGLPVNNAIYTIAFQGNNIYAGTYQGVYLSSNNGSNWTEINNGLPVNNLQVYSLAIQGNNIYAGTHKGIYLSNNNGSDWTAVNNGLPANTCFVGSLAIQGNNIYAGINLIFNFPNGGGLITGGGIYLSANNGSNWTAVNNGLPTYLYNQVKYNYSINTIAFQGNNIFAGTNRGVYFSSNNGGAWISINNGLPSVPSSVTDVLTIAVQDNNIYAGIDFDAYGSGVFLLQNTEQ
jgi:photosystem II stability/assembly factor-like uncharacterized protein